MVPSRIPRRAALVRLEQVGDDLLLYHPGLTKALHLNRTASLIWQLCDGHRSAQEIGVLLAEAFGGTEGHVAEAVETILQQFADEGVIEFA